MTEILDVLRTSLHYSMHLLFPGLIAWIFFREKFRTAWIIMIATMLVDLDHLLATPIFDPNRCSIGFHPLHSYLAIAFYLFLLLVPNVYVRMVGVGLIFHMITDFQDCLWIS